MDDKRYLTVGSVPGNGCAYTVCVDRILVISIPEAQSTLEMRLD